VFGVLTVVGVPLGVLWWALAPRADYRITSSGPVVIGNPSEELLIADDGVFVFIALGLGLLAGVLTWLFRRRRGVAALLGVALGTLAGSAVAWQVGELLGPGPSKAELAKVGARVTTSLTLGALPALAVAPFAALLVWLVGTLYAKGDGLGRPTPATDAAAVAEPVEQQPEPAER
jgi:LPXTG-motif cell wall-anchored protein